MITQAAPEQPTPKPDAVAVYAGLVFVRLEADTYVVDYGLRPDASDLCEAAFEEGVELPKVLNEMIVARAYEVREWANVTNLLCTGAPSEAQRRTMEFIEDCAGRAVVAINQLNTLALECVMGSAA